MTASEDFPTGAAAATDDDPTASPPTPFPRRAPVADTRSNWEITMDEIRQYQVANAEAAARAVAQTHSLAQNATAQQWEASFDLAEWFGSESSDEDDEDIPATLSADERHAHLHRQMMSDMAWMQRELLGAFGHSYMASQLNDYSGFASSPTANPRARQDPMAATAAPSQSSLPSVPAPLSASTRNSSTMAPASPLPSSATVGSSAADEDSDDSIDETVPGRYMYFDEIQARVEAGVAMLRNEMAAFPSWHLPSTSSLPPPPGRNPNRSTEMEAPGTDEAAHGAGADGNAADN
ncbi:hypothetical protein SCUCBS95973_000409 [Sporothrix curviconia]|uniref:Uncharacterized protein n=1 Tax=Sporothrix curviconia TaxID=1260050 RepID=A0ABP0AQ06_9PEZI